MTSYKEDIYGLALKEFYEHQKPFYLKLHNNYGKPEKMPIEVFFREDQDLSELEQLAIEECSGSVLDIGAGTGVHALILQDIGLDVTAVDISPAAVEVMEMSGVNKAIQNDVRHIRNEKFDTLLLLMNGLGIAGKLEELPNYLITFKNLLKPGGKIVLDSSDVSYLQNPVNSNSYVGEIEYQYEHKGEKGKPFNWLYVDKQTLENEAMKLGLSFEIIYEDENDQYLAVLQIAK
ncbi:MAG: class I SAM-dependent methyltransferase [Bacteroidota bacterium]